MFKFLKKKDGKDTFSGFAKGTMKSLDSVPDAVFAQKMMGDGFAIELEEGKIYSPVDGEITLVFPTGHAYGITTDRGVEVLIHIGIDTVELEGQGFNGKVKQGSRVKQGDLLTEVDLDFIRGQGKPTITPMIFTSGHAVELLKVDERVDKNTNDLFSFKEV
ncbi:PTS glucose transporter subunit IIA [Erysipelothrix urinaevulpis]|uniref:PTS sugar transporter subunit IIA n=1 Tax=Erysipelothrix urinaevulpis TaxID=2683717 RepID=UPI00135A9EB3|nr:PTS glucose transporter subunit IIA [Erysipelothrix urinaevulpis]